MYLEAALIIITAVSGLDADPEKSYLLIEASTVGENTAQPTWIGLKRGEVGLIHVSADKSIVELIPGTYELHHFDFQMDKDSGKGTLHVSKGIKLMLEPGKIYFYGAIELHKISRGKYDLKFGNKTILLQKACEKAPKVFREFHLSSNDNSREIMLSCGH